MRGEIVFVDWTQRYAEGLFLRIGHRERGGTEMHGGIVFEDWTQRTQRDRGSQRDRRRMNETT